MSFSRWLRATSEHYLMIAAQQKIAAKYQVAPPPPPRGTEWFWLRVYVPAYRAVPWPVRSAIMRRLPGSHRMTWTKTQRPARPTQLPVHSTIRRLHADHHWLAARRSRRRLAL